MSNGTWIAGFVPSGAFIEEVSAAKGRLDDAEARLAALEAAVRITTIMSGDDHALFVDLNSIEEQSFTVPHTLGAVPAARRVFIEPVAAPTLDLSNVCLEYVRYFPVSSTPTTLHVTVRLQQASGVAGQQGQLRIVILP